MKSEASTHRGRGIVDTFAKNTKINSQVATMKEKMRRTHRKKMHCDHADDDVKIEEDEQDNHTPEFTMKENWQTGNELKRKISRELTKKRQN